MLYLMKQRFHLGFRLSPRSGLERGFLVPLLAGLLLCTFSGLNHGLAEEEDKVEDTGPSWFDRHFSGQFRTVYRYRSYDGERDSDLYEYFYLRGRELAGGRLDAYASGKLYWDLDDASTDFGDDIYAGAEDLDGDFEDRIYQLYVDGHDKQKRYRLRVGRQYVDAADSLHLDGAQVLIMEDGVIGGRVFYGQPVSYYSSVSHDHAGGFSLVGKPWSGNRSRLTGTLYHDHSADETDTLLVFHSRQEWEPAIQSRLRASLLNDDFQMAGLDLYYLPPDDDLTCIAGLHRWGSFDADTRAYSPLYRVLGELNPYTYAYARMTIGVFSWLQVSPGLAARLVDSSDQDAHNRDYRHGDLTLTFEPNRAWDISLSGEYWDVEEGDRFFGLSGDVRYRHKRIWEVSAGAAYVDYEYERDSDFSYTFNGGATQISADGTRIDVSPDAYTYYLRGKWNINKILSVRIRGEVEDYSPENEHSYAGRLSSVVRF